MAKGALFLVLLRGSLVLLLLLLLVRAASSSLTSQQQHNPPPPAVLSPLDLAALVSIKSSLIDLPGTRFFSTWDFSSSDPCSSFAGITCSPAAADSPSGNVLRVSTLSLGTGLSDSPGLAGTLTPAISNLTELTQLILFPGFVTGPIPPQIGPLLSNLRVLSLTHNRLTGPIPPGITALRRLHTLDLSFNQLSGSIPPGISDLAELKVLVLSSNRLSGDITKVVMPTGLLHMDLKQNNLVGTLDTLTLPSTLRYLSLAGNSMWGPLKGLESLSELVYLDLSMNRFGGPIPPSLLRPSLSSLLLQRNNFTGGIPPAAALLPQGRGRPQSDQETTPSSSSILDYGQGSLVDLSHNNLAGELPEVLAGVQSLYLNNNRLSGTVPQEYVWSVREGKTTTLYLQHNFFSGFPMREEVVLPDGVDVCLSYNCMVPPVGLATCPTSAGGQLSRPAVQCSVFRNGGLILN